MDDQGSIQPSDPRGDDSLADTRLAAVVYRCLLDGMIVMDHRGRISEFNHRAVEIFGYQQEEALGQELAELIVPEEHRDAHRAGMAHFLKHGEGSILGQRIEIEGLCKGGGRVPIELAVAAEHLDGQPVFVATLRDLTQARKREAELDRVRGYLDDVSIHGPTVFFVVRRRHGKSVLGWISPNIASILGFDAQALETGEVDWNSHLHPEDASRVSEHRKKIWEEGYGQLEYRILDMDGRIRWIRESRRVVVAREGQPEVVGSVEDMTDARRSEYRERMLRRELDHRVKNNLQIILGECDKAVCDQEIDRDRIVGLTARVASMAMIHQMLAERSWTPIDLSELVRSGERALVGQADSNRIQCEGPGLQIGVDAAMTLGSVINELITNATKYGGLSSRGDGVEVCWHIDREGPQPMLNLKWQESVPSGDVSDPVHRSFGMQLIEGMIPYELEGQVAITFAATGLRFDATMPLANCQVDIGRMRGHAMGGETLP